MSTRSVDIRGSHRYLFFTSSSGPPRTNKGRQALTRRIGGHSSTKYYSGICDTADFNRSDSSLLTRTSSTQTDIRDSEIQTDPWWQQAEGLALLCCRGSHRKLDKAKWLARHRTAVISETEDPGRYSSIGEMNNLEEDRVRAGIQNDGTRSSVSDVNQDNMKKRSIGSGPTYGSRRFLPDPSDMWVGTFQKIRHENEIFEQQVALKRRRLLGRQRNAPVFHSCTSLSSNSKKSQLSGSKKIYPNYLQKHRKVLEHVPPKVSSEVLEELCLALSYHNI